MQNNFKLSSLMIVMAVGLTCKAYAADASDNKITATAVLQKLRNTPTEQFNKELRGLVGKRISGIPGHETESWHLASLQENSHTPTPTGTPNRFDATFRTNTIRVGFVTTWDTLRLHLSPERGERIELCNSNVIAYNKRDMCIVFLSGLATTFLTAVYTLN